MQIALKRKRHFCATPLVQLLRAMRLIAFIMLIACLQASATGYSQKITLDLRDVPLGKVFKEIRRQSGYFFLYNNEQVNKAEKVSLKVDKASLEEALEKCLSSTPFTFRIIDRTIVLNPKPKPTEQNISEIPVFQKITGTLLSSDKKEPLQGATISVKGTTIMTITDSKGSFVINAEPGSTLVISYVGYETREIKVGSETTLNLELKINAGRMQELIVSYGTQRQREVTGSITQLKAEETKDMPVGQFAQKLQGKFAGVQVSQTTGRPGQGMAFRIRGAASINSNNVPLFVMDGQPLTGDINNINPDEIESYTILKDASATALYGSRAANGVILITTRQAKAGPTRIDLNGYYGLQQFDNSHRPPMMNAREFASFMKAFFEDKIAYEGWVNPATGLAQVPDEYQNPDQYGAGTDWLKQELRTAPIQNYSLALSDYREKSSTSVVAGYFNQQGILKNTGYQRYSVRINNEFRPDSRLKIGLNLAPSVQLEHNTQVNSDGQRQIIEGALLASSTIKPYNPDGTMVNQSTGYFLLPNPNWEKVVLNAMDNYKTSRLLGDAYLELRLLKGLKFKTRADVDMQGQTHNRFSNRIAAAGLGAIPPVPVSSISAVSGYNNYYSWLNENLLTYQHTFGDHSIEALGGYTAQKYRLETNQVNGSNFPDETVTTINAAGTTTGTSGTESWSLLSLIGRLNYSYKGRYLLSGAVRRDGSSRFGADRKWGTFPSVSAGWIVSDETFMRTFRPVSYLKIRASYGVTGNNNIGNYTSNSLMGPANYVFNNVLTGGRAESQLGNTLLSWEKNKQFDLGVDISFLNDRISFTYDYYNKITDGLLYKIDIPQSSGFGSVNSNIGTIKFWGHEFNISSKNMMGALKWTTDFNISFNRNLVTKLGTQNLPILPNNQYNTPWITAVGHPLGVFYGFINDGVYMTQHEFDTQPHEATSKVGTVRMKDVDHSGVIDLNDRTYIGDPNPNFLFGLTNMLSYRNFDMSIAIAGSVGGDIEDGLAESSENLDGAFNVYKRDANHWRSEANPGNGVVPRTLNGTTALYRTISTNFIHDGSYLTCKNITLGYTFNKFRGFKYIKQPRLYLSVQQAFVIMGYLGFSPEANSNGLNGLYLGHDNSTYPVPRTVTVGLNLGL